MGFFGSSRKRKVLLIDDEASTRTMMAMFFEELGFSVVEASSGDHGIQLADDETPDIILLDIMMPGLSGFDTLRFFRGNPKTKSTPIIMVTARELVEDVEHCLEGGANDFIQKPFDLRTLQTKVEKFLPKK